MSRDQLMDVTYAAGRRLNRIKANYGLVPAAQAEATEQRIDRAVVLNHEIDRLVAHATHDEFEAEMARLKPELEHVNMSTVCDKRELNVDMTGPRLNYGQVAQMLVQDTLRGLGQSLAAPFRRLTPAYVQSNS